MIQSHRLLVNTLTLYLRIIVNSIVVLVSTRIALEELGVDSFGLYNLIAGVITLLTFFSGALTISSQRFFSIAIGEKKNENLNKILNLSLAVHFGLSVLIIVFFKLLQPFLFDGFLNIQEKDIESAITVYNVMIFSCVITIVTIPFNALIISKEQIWFSSISDIVSILFKLFAAIMLFFIIDDKLIVYTYLMLFAVLIGALINIFWCNLRYDECSFNFNFSKNDKYLFSEMFSFASWNTLGALSMVARNQGIAIVLNIFFGTVANAAYGVANQVNTLVITFASTLTTVFSPSIIKAKGEDNNEKMLFIAVFSSKLSFLLSTLFALPVYLFCDIIVKFWLSIVPDYTLIFIKCIVSSFLITQLYPGITRALYAEGNIKWYQIVISFLLVSILPFGYFLFIKGFSIFSIFILLIFAQILTLFSTLYFAKNKIGLKLNVFFSNSICIPVVLLILCYLLGEGFKILFQNIYLTVFTGTVFPCLLYLFLYYKFVFDELEIQYLNKFSDSVYNKLKQKL